MLRTKSQVSTVSDVPREWVFEYYLKLSIKLHGQDVKIKSPFNPAGDKLPSFFVYCASGTNKYSFKDFSTDRQGDGVTLVKELFNLKTRGEAAHMVIEDYNKYVLSNPTTNRFPDFQAQSRYKVASFTTRQWNKLDEQYWTQFHIGSRLLTYYKIKPLRDYTLVKELQGGKKDVLVMNNTQMYGYFRSDGTLYKIYQPFTKIKFIKILDYIQGTDQLKFDKKYLIICSSLKDMMAFSTLGIKNAEYVAPDSENTLIPERIIKAYRQKYQAICTIFDNDTAGIRSMKKYEKVYKIPSVHLDLEKDIADAVKEHGIDNTRIHLYPLLTKALTGKTKHV